MWFRKKKPMKDSKRNQDLIDVASKGKIQKVKALLAKGADANAKDNDGWTALMMASWKGHSEVVNVLLAKGADVNANNNGMTALILASENGHSEVVNTLLAKDADVNAKDRNGWTALKWASMKGHSEIIKALKEAVAKTTPGQELIFAADYGNIQEVNTLLAKGADALLQNDQTQKKALASAFANSGAALARLGKVGLACIEWRAALFLAPENEKYRANVGDVLKKAPRVFDLGIIDAFNRCLAANKYSECIEIGTRSFAHGINILALYNLWYPYFYSGQVYRAFSCLLLHIESGEGIHADKARGILKEILKCTDSELDSYLHQYWNSG